MAASKLTRRLRGLMFLVPVTVCCACTTVDPGRNYSLAAASFDADYFYCHVEPEFIFAKRCGPGDPSKGDSNSCHFNSSAVSGMALFDHPPVDCGGGNHPVDRTQIGTASLAQSNFESVSFEMSKDYTIAPLLLRPSGGMNAPLPHPRMIFDPNDAQVIQLLSTWSNK